MGATQNILIASCFSKGKTKLRNCASEPEVQDLINFLKKLDYTMSAVVGLAGLQPTIDAIKISKVAKYFTRFTKIR